MSETRGPARVILCAAALLLAPAPASAVIVPFSEQAGIGISLPPESTLPIGGTLVASRTVSITGTSRSQGLTLSDGTLVEEVYRNSTGTVDFVYRFNYAGPSQALLSIPGFQREINLVDIHVSDAINDQWVVTRQDGGPNPDGTIAGGAHLNLNDFSFTSAQMSTSAVVLIHTDAPDFSDTTAELSFTNGIGIGAKWSDISIDAFAPIPGVGTSVPEPLSLGLLPLSVVVLGLKFRRKLV